MSTRKSISIRTNYSNRLWSEWQNEFNNLLDYHQTFFRNYDPATGRFIASDPIPESAESMTTYQYAGNNPVMMNDPIGNFKKLPSPPMISYGNGVGDNNDNDFWNHFSNYDGGDGGGEGGDYSAFWNNALSTGTAIALSLDDSPYSSLIYSGNLFEATVNAVTGSVPGLTFYVNGYSNGSVSEHFGPLNNSMITNSNNLNFNNVGQIINKSLINSYVNGLDDGGGNEPFRYQYSIGRAMSFSGFGGQYGAILNLAYIAPSDAQFDFYRWVQIVSSSALGGEKVIDDTYHSDNYPFYYENGEESTNGYAAFFSDFANSNVLNFFNAEVALLGYRNGQYTTLGDFRWGYYTSGYIGNDVTLFPFTPSTPSNFMQWEIDYLNTK